MMLLLLLFYMVCTLFVLSSHIRSCLFLSLVDKTCAVFFIIFLHFLQQFPDVFVIPVCFHKAHSRTLGFDDSYLVYT